MVGDRAEGLLGRSMAVVGIQAVEMLVVMLIKQTRTRSSESWRRGGVHVSPSTPSGPPAPTMAALGGFQCFLHEQPSDSSANSRPAIARHQQHIYRQFSNMPDTDGGPRSWPAHALAAFPRHRVQAGGAAAQTASEGLASTLCSLHAADLTPR